MPFGLKNTPSEFQKVMNDIFNPYTTFLIVYIDDVFSQNIEQHFKHLKTFIHIIKKNGLIISNKKTNLFQIKIRFLGHYVHNMNSFWLILILLGSNIIGQKMTRASSPILLSKLSKSSRPLHGEPTLIN